MIYFIRDTETSAIKIGYSKDHFRRLAMLQTAHANRLELIAAIEGDRKGEQLLHEKFSDSQMRGEWFSPSTELVAYIAALGPPAPRPRKYPETWGKSGLNTAQLAEVMGVSVAQMGRYRSGRSEPTLSGAIRLAEITGLPIESFAKKGGA